MGRNSEEKLSFVVWEDEMCRGLDKMAPTERETTEDVTSLNPRKRKKTHHTGHQYQNLFPLS